MDLLVEFMSMKIKDQTQITNNYFWTSLVYLFKSLLFKKKPSRRPPFNRGGFLIMLRYDCGI